MSRHCEERSDGSIQPESKTALDCFATLAMTAHLPLAAPAC
ncbi:MAG TPA: hypothetical protein VFR28_02545 [Allosphingosinicella sp.]|nr:hypothetical protein [Allosphingosinicella sp.]